MHGQQPPQRNQELLHHESREAIHGHGVRRWQIHDLSKSSRTDVARLYKRAQLLRERLRVVENSTDQFMSKQELIQVLKRIERNPNISFGLVHTHWNSINATLRHAPDRLLRDFAVVHGDARRELVRAQQEWTRLRMLGNAEIKALANDLPHEKLELDMERLGCLVLAASDNLGESRCLWLSMNGTYFRKTHFRRRSEPLPPDQAVSSLVAASPFLTYPSASLMALDSYVSELGAAQLLFSLKLFEHHDPRVAALSICTLPLKHLSDLHLRVARKEMSGQLPSTLTRRFGRCVIITLINIRRSLRDIRRAVYTYISISALRITNMQRGEALAEAEALRPGARRRIVEFIKPMLRDKEDVEEVEDEDADCRIQRENELQQKLRKLRRGPAGPLVGPSPTAMRTTDHDHDHGMSFFATLKRMKADKGDRLQRVEHELAAAMSPCHPTNSSDYSEMEKVLQDLAIIQKCQEQPAEPSQGS